MRDINLAQAYRANAETLRATTGNALWNPDTHSVLFRTGKSLGESGAVRRAIEYLRDLHGLIGHHLNHDHPDTLTTRSKLAWWSGSTHISH